MPTVTPEKWRDLLYPQVVTRAPKLKRFDDFYQGNHPIPFLTEAHADKMRSAFKQMLDESKANFMRIVIDTIQERLRIEGIRLSATSDPTSDKESWDIWQANQLDSLHSDAILDSLVKGVSYLSVWDDVDGDGYPDIAVEDARECIVHYAPGTNFRVRNAALKVWRDSLEGVERCNLYTPTEVHRWYREIGTPLLQTEQRMFDPEVPFQYPGEEKSGLGDTTLTGFQDGSPTSWRPYGDEPIPNAIGVVPIIPLRNRGRLLTEGESEIFDSTHIQMQINSFVFLLALAGYFGAHKQRWVTGLTLMEDDETGKVEEPFDVAIDKMLAVEDENVKFGEFAQTDMTGYLKTIDQKAGHLAIKHRLPKHYLLPEGQAPSGDSLESSESGLVRLAQDKASRFDDGFEEAIRIARKLKTGEDTPIDSEMVWSDPKTISESAIADSVIKKYEAGLISKDQAQEDLGYTQTQIARMKRAATKDQLTADPAAPASSGQSENVILPNGA